MSKEHCHIELIEDGYVLKDLGSLNGTFVNGERVKEHRLEPGDEITIGSTRIVFEPKDRGGHLTFAGVVTDTDREATNRFKIGESGTGWANSPLGRR